LVLSITTVGLVFGAIAPHGGLAVAEACTPDELELAQATRAGMGELGRAFTAARPDVVVVATPHNVHIAGAFAVVVAGRVAGSLEGTPQPVALDVPSETALAWLLLETLIADDLPALGVSFGSNDPSAAVAPMDWGVLIPLWFMGGRHEPPLPVVVIAPARDLPAVAHVRAGAAIASAAAASGRRVAFIASADHGHAHRADGPYGYHSDAKVYDERVRRLVEADQLSGLLEISPDLVERAKADSWWQMMMLLGATGDGWRGRLISYEAPTYFGMLTAVYEPKLPVEPPHRHSRASRAKATSPHGGEETPSHSPHGGEVTLSQSPHGGEASRDTSSQPRRRTRPRTRAH
jgi:aromatic ring-opening dioxygenase LigB subunit